MSADSAVVVTSCFRQQVFATTTNCPADYTNRNWTCAHGYLPDDPGDVAGEVGRLALRDRNHASVIWYSLCNEVRHPHQPALAIRRLSIAFVLLSSCRSLVQARLLTTTGLGSVVDVRRRAAGRARC